MHGFRFSRIFLCLSVGMSAGLFAQNTDEIRTLDAYVVHSGAIANETPLPSYANAVSLLSFSPRVDVQSRNFSEAQGDISIRGGTFENTGFNIGGLAIFDPQTGHYLTEVPIDPLMIGLPKIMTGFENQKHSFNANVGSIHYDWNAVATAQGQVALSFGENQLNTQSIYLARPLSGGEQQATLDLGIARSESEGTIAFGDHQFTRYSGRFQYRTPTSSLNLFAGYQDKFFGWPNMYTPYNVQETEDIQTLLCIVDYRTEYSPGTAINLASYYRINWDDYEFDRDRPGLYNPYEHKTQVAGFHSSWSHTGSSQIEYGLSGDMFFDAIDSTTLTHSFQSRTYAQLKAYTSIPDLVNRLDLDVSVSIFDTNRNATALNPAIRASWDLTDNQSPASSACYAEYTSGSQVSGYTAIGSARSGLFAGNPDLGLERTHNFEIGYQWQNESIAFQMAAFYRLDRDLTDWTFNFDRQNARTANAVDIDTTGFEILASRQWKHSLLSLGYTFLEKAEDYGNKNIDASFYALNYANHRVTLSLIQQLHSKLELRLDSEYRVQQDNALRRSGQDAILAYLSLQFHPMETVNWYLRLSVENLLDSEFEEIPAVPASRRQFALQSTFSW